MVDHPSKNFIQNVFVASLPQDLLNGVTDVKAGKSFFCSKFGSCARDDLVDDHSSVYYVSHLTHPVINNDMFLYWGSREYDISQVGQGFSSLDCTFLTQNLFEFTYLRSSNKVPLAMEDYVNSLLRRTFPTPKKQMYVRHHQVYESAKYPAKFLDLEEVEMNACIILVDVSNSSEKLHQQFRFLKYFYEQAVNTDLKYSSIIVASKCDACENVNGLKALYKFVLDNNIRLRIVETSALFNININYCFFMMIHKFCKKLFKNIPRPVFTFTKLQLEQMDTFFNIVCIEPPIRTGSDSSVSFASGHSIIDIVCDGEFLQVVYKSFRVAFSYACKEMKTLMEEYIDATYDFNKFPTFSRAIFAFSKIESAFKLYNKALSVFGNNTLRMVFKETKCTFKNVEKWLCDLYVELLAEEFKSYFPDISSMANCSWNWEACRDIISGSSIFEENSNFCLPKDPWCSPRRLYSLCFIFALNLNSVSFIKINIPKDFLDHPVSQKTFAKHVSSLSNKGKTGKIHQQLEEQLEKLIKDNVFKVGFALEEVAYYLLFKGYDNLSQKIMESEYYPIYYKYADKLRDKAREELNELLLEHAHELDQLVKRNISLQDVKSLVGADERFSSLESRLMCDRDGWCLNHLACRGHKDSCVYILNSHDTCIEEKLKQFFNVNKVTSNESLISENTQVINLFVIAPNTLWLSLNAFLHETYGDTYNSTETFVTNSSSKGIFTYHKIINNTEVKIPFTVTFTDTSWGDYNRLTKEEEGVKCLNNGIIVVYDINSPNSTSNIDSFFKGFVNYVPTKISDDSTKYLFRIPNIVKIYNCSFKSQINANSEEGVNVPTDENEEIASHFIKRSQSECDIVPNIGRSPSFHTLLERYDLRPTFTIDDDSSKYQSIIEEMLDEMSYIVQGLPETEFSIMIYVCIMCGDNVSLESIIRMIVFRRKYTFRSEANEIHVIINNKEVTYKVRLKFTSYHGSYNIETTDGLIAVCCSHRKASVEAVRSLFARNRKIPSHVINIIKSKNQDFDIPGSNVFQLNQQVSKSGVSLVSPSSTSRTLFDSHLKLNEFFGSCIEMKINFETLSTIPKDVTSNSDLSKLIPNYGSQKKDGYRSKGSISQTDVVWVVNPLIKISTRSRICNTLKRTKISDLKKNSDVVSTFGKQTDRFMIAKPYASILQTGGTQRPVSDAITYRTKEPMYYKSRLIGKKSENSQTSNKRNSMELPQTNLLDMISDSSVKIGQKKGNIELVPQKPVVREVDVKTVTPKQIKTDRKIMTLDRASIGKLLHIWRKKDAKKMNDGNRGSGKGKQTMSDKINEWNNRQLSKAGTMLDGCGNRYFGLPIEDVCTETEPPLFLKRVFAHIEKYSIRSIGLYRVSGSKDHIETLIRDFQEDMEMEFNANMSIHVYSGGAKYFMRMLPIPLMRIEHLREIALLKEITEETARNVRIREICDMLDPKCYITMITIMKHLSRVALNSDDNQMKPYNLSLCWWPTIVRPEVFTISGFTNDAPMFTGFFQDMISRYDQIFE